MLLTGARPGEVLTLRWEDVNTKWKGLTIRDKVEGERVIPLTPYAWHLLKPLPRGKGWVFASSLKAAKSEGRMVLATPSKFHGEACAAAGIDGLTLHGLRRSFASLTEWLEIPAGVVARAGAILKSLEKSQGGRSARARIDDLPLFANLSPPPPEDLPSAPPEDPLGPLLDAIDPDALTPREALDALYKLKREREQLRTERDAAA